ncbi:GNAT family N-acetyltransferase [Nocardioides taihuensis]|uniref:GNAT family N-acetyltransferase n=1 Tax=Nocardioides taihuensis TaxID=1835606 RepID=A0ABW0BLJ4_9ACTN
MNSPSVLARPDVRFHASWVEAVAEYARDGSQQHGSGLWDFDPLDVRREFFPTIVEHLLRQGDPATVLPGNLVHSSYFWIVDGDEFVGYLALRHALTAWLLEEGGHIGFSVRPSRRRQGWAGRALAASLPEARALGLERVLVTCDEDNEGSRRTIEGGGGVYEDSRKGKRRYWIAVP